MSNSTSVPNPVQVDGKIAKIGLKSTAVAADIVTIKLTGGRNTYVFCFRIKVMARRRIDLP